MIIRTRIAPSPTGIAHLGTAYTALRNWALARQKDGKFIIRVEDTDRERYVENAVSVIFEGLAWLGIDHDEGPDIGGPFAPYTQSERLEIYRKHAQNLIEKNQAYYCFCTKERLEELRARQQADKELPRYDKRCRTLNPEEAKKRADGGEPCVVRLAVPEQGETTFTDLIRGTITFENTGIDDQVLLKSDGYPTYHLGVVVDDHLMEITHVVRGEEWLSSTPKHVLLYQAFGWELPQFAHVPIIRNVDHSKMSKRKNDVSILSYRDKGYLPEAMNNFLALLGWSHPEKKEVFSMADFIKEFTLERVTTTAPVFDLDKLNWLNGVYIRELEDEDLLKRLRPFIPKDCPETMVPSIIPLIKERLVTLNDFEALTDFFYRKKEIDNKLLTKHSTPEEVRVQLQTTNHELSTIEDNKWSHENIEQKIRSLSEKNSWKPAQYFMMLRIAATGRSATPPLFETLEVMGKKTTLSRLQKTL